METCTKRIHFPTDDEGCMPKIINTVSLQGCSELSFNEYPENEEYQSVLYPKCEIKEEDTAIEDIKTEPVEHEVSHCSKDEGEKCKQEKKRVTVVDVKNLALQESLFKTKELFDTFLRVCQDHENTEQMERVVQKMSHAYSAAKQEFLGSLAFQNILESETEKVNTSNTKPWLNLKMVLDELKHNKKCGSSKLKLGESEESQDAGGSNDDEPVIECPKKRRHLKKLEKVLRAINLKIKKIEEREVDWEEEDNSAYCKLDRYRNQFTKIYAKICEIKGKLPDADRPYLRKVSFAGTTYPHINRCIEKYYNKHREFPDFQDIKKLVILALKQEGIEMQPIKIHSMAAAAFKEFGEMLKRLRQYDDYDVLISYLDQQVDPARDNEQLQELLNQNALLFKKKEQEVIDKFAEKESVKDICSDSGEDSDDKPKKKKKIITKNPNPKKKPSSPVKQNLSSSESEDEESENTKPNTGFGLSSNSESDSEGKRKKKSTICKGKALIGKQRILKKGINKSSTNKSQMPKTCISSEEESAPRNTKESLTNYLGLKGQGCSNTTATNESKVFIREAKTQRISQPFTRDIYSDDSDSDETSETKPAAQSRKNDKTISDDCSIHNSTINTIIDSDSDIEPIAVIDRPPSQTKNTRKQSNQARKSTGPRFRNVVPAKPVAVTKNNMHEKISDSESESRTSDEGCGSVKKKISDVDLSPDSSDENVRKKRDAKDDADDTIVILSEDIIEEPKPAATKQVSSKPKEDCSDSDDIFILSQVEIERRTVAPRKMKPNSGSGLTDSSTRKPNVATSTPNKSCPPVAVLKRRISNQSNNGRSTKTRKVDMSTYSKQTALPQIINGASRKVLPSRAFKSASSSGNSTPESIARSTPEPIPLIELD